MRPACSAGAVDLAVDASRRRCRRIGRHLCSDRSGAVLVKLADLLVKLADLLVKRKAELAMLDSLQMDKPLREDTSPRARRALKSVSFAGG